MTEKPLDSKAAQEELEQRCRKFDEKYGPIRELSLIHI